MKNIYRYLKIIKKSVVEKTGELPKNSVWDFSVKPVKDYLKIHLKDPNSVEYIEWFPVRLCRVEGKLFWKVRVKFKAKNSFGGFWGVML